MTPKGHGKKPYPFIVCRTDDCMRWGYVMASEPGSGNAGCWKLPDGWSWVHGRGGLCPAHTLSASPSVPTQDDAPTCPDCGDLMVRSGRCHTCQNCGHNDGCG